MFEDLLTQNKNDRSKMYIALNHIKPLQVLSLGSLSFTMNGYTICYDSQTSSKIYSDDDKDFTNLFTIDILDISPNEYYLSILSTDYKLEIEYHIVNEADNCEYIVRFDDESTELLSYDFSEGMWGCAIYCLTISSTELISSFDKNDTDFMFNLSLRVDNDVLLSKIPDMLSDIKFILGYLK